jgi:hypothetical protein
MGGDDGDPGAPTINVKNVDGRPPGPHGGDLHPGSKMCVVNLHRYDTEKVIMLTGPILLALSSVMTDDP